MQRFGKRTAHKMLWVFYENLLLFSDCGCAGAVRDLLDIPKVRKNEEANYGLQNRSIRS